jgi:hypothetical protein
MKGGEKEKTKTITQRVCNIPCMNSINCLIESGTVLKCPHEFVNASIMKHWNKIIRIGLIIIFSRSFVLSLPLPLYLVHRRRRSIHLFCDEINNLLLHMSYNEIAREKPVCWRDTYRTTTFNGLVFCSRLISGTTRERIPIHLAGSHADDIFPSPPISKKNILQTIRQTL